MIKKGDRVQVTSDYLYGQLNGTGTVLYVTPNELIQVAVLLDKPCADGHRHYRFTYKEVQKIGG